MTIKMQIKKKKHVTLPETNIAPGRKPSQKETSLPTIHFQLPPSFKVHVGSILHEWPKGPSRQRKLNVETTLGLILRGSTWKVRNAKAISKDSNQWRSTFLRFYFSAWHIFWNSQHCDNPNNYRNCICLSLESHPPAVFWRTCQGKNHQSW